VKRPVEGMSHRAKAAKPRTIFVIRIYIFHQNQRAIFSTSQYIPLEMSVCDDVFPDLICI
jgi:hypothetical protein